MAGPKFIPPLTGQANYLQWSRDFQTLARLNKLGGGFGNHVRLDDEPHHLCVPFLMLCVSPSIRAIMDQQDFVDDSDGARAWDFLEKQYKMDNDQILKLAEADKAKLRLRGTQSVTAYVSKLEQIKADMKSAGKDLSDWHLIDTLLSGCSKNYDALKAKASIAGIIAQVAEAIKKPHGSTASNIELAAGALKRLVGELLVFEAENKLDVITGLNRGLGVGHERNTVMSTRSELADAAKEGWEMM